MQYRYVYSDMKNRSGLFALFQIDSIDISFLFF